ncbi:MAG: tetratricopeptide repeat protein [Clostridiales bacterium]|jgi:tetratricopeptide (TPR) repeat protein|nr:tetratricopeptide repeat protein [Clostridiales bacterium]
MSKYGVIEDLRQDFAERYAAEDWAASVDICRRIDAEHRKSGAVETIAFADDQYNYASALMELKDYKKARALLFESLRRVKRLGAPAAAVAMRCNNLGVCEARLSRPGDALKFFELAAETAERLTDSAEYADARYNAANALYDMGEFDRALAIHLELRAGADGVRGIDVLNGAAYCHEKKGDAVSAARYLRLAMDAAKGLFGGASPEYLANLYYLAVFSFRTGEYQAAADAFGETLQVLKRVSSGSGAFYADTLNHLADAKAAAGDVRGALRDRLESLRIIRARIGENHVYYANCLKHIALLYKQFDPDECERNFRRALAIKLSLIGAANADYIRDALALSGIMVERFRYDAALELLSETLDGLQNSDSDEAFTELIPDVTKVMRAISGARKVRDALPERLLARLIEAVENPSCGEPSESA